jgi:hypothetical protein
MTSSTPAVRAHAHNTQRRPAMIPTDAITNLSSEDKQAIKLRTGRYPVFFHPAATNLAAGWSMQSHSYSDAQTNTNTNAQDLGKYANVTTSVREVDGPEDEDELLRMKKRKASTSAEVYRERCAGDGNPAGNPTGNAAAQSRLKT